MAASLKEELIRFLQALRNLPQKEKTRFQAALLQLEQNRIVIPETTQGKQEICHFLGLLFTEMPELMTPANKALLGRFSDEIKISAVPEMTATRQPSRKK